MKANEVLQLEKQLSFHSFNNEDAYQIALSLVDRVKNDHLKNIRIRVVLNHEIIFQYLMDGKSGDIWLNRKQKTVELFHHSSYYVYLENQEKGTYQQYENDESLVICGGGFPIIVNQKVIGSIIVSGLAHDEDHQLIVNALCQYKQKLKYALASDVDGTLFFQYLNPPYKIGDIQAIKKFQDAGHLFGVCTGRALCNLDDIRKFHLDFYIVTSGAVLLDKDYQIIEEHPISKNIAKSIFDEYKDQAGVIIQSSSYTKFYATIDEFHSDQLCIIHDFNEIQEDKIYGVSLVVDDETTAAKLKQELDRRYPELEGFQNKNSIDIVKKGCSKGMSLKRIKEILKVDKVAGIGDSYNDISLIENADVGFTFYDSPKEVQDRALYLVEHIEQAIDQLMEDK